MRALVQALVRIGVVVLFGASAWYGFVAGLRRWAPCIHGFDTYACVTVQTHEITHLPELGYPEAVSLQLLGGGIMLLALLGAMPLLLRVLALAAGPVSWWFAHDLVASIGQTEVPPPPPGGYVTPPLEAVASIGAVVMPAVLVGVAWVLLVGTAEQRGRSPGDRRLGIAWLAMAVGWPLTEFFLLGVFYASHDAPPGTGLLRSTAAVVAAGCVLQPLLGLGSRLVLSRLPARRERPALHRAG